MRKKVIVDIDGTLSKVGDRLQYLKQDPPDWDRFYANCSEDLPVINVCKIVNELSYKYDIVFCTGRRESCREDTLDFLSENVWEASMGSPLLMRKDSDIRPDTEVKPELLEDVGIEPDQIAFVIEDRNSMTKKWREMGLVCFQVADGDF